MLSTFFILLLLLNTTLIGTLESVDLETLQLINNNRLTTLDIMLYGITATAYFICALAPVFLYLIGYLRKEIRLKLKACQCMFTLGLTTVLVAALKYSIDRTRPFISSDMVEQIASAGSPSFPSGHTALTFATATAIILMFKNALLRGLVLTWALVVGYSRLALGVHYPSDVLASVVIATTSAAAANYIFLQYQNQLYPLLISKRNT
ncbi:phosphatase PAP2 family protein [Pontibacter korlensis]|uniref:phosphatase PAP2 family protein n=1 Tax=Pontibacter korlensis TaxID=400092 RepID=UPI000696F893|nr:phosphatase PAP2 family protein [Pontibacter korlensis]